MPRIIGAKKNEVVFEDNISGSQLALHYRMPTTKERQGYLNASVKRTGNKVTLHHAEARLDFGARILVGVREGDFMRMVDGKAVVMSSDPSSPDYSPDWKTEMQTGCADLVMALAGHVFDGSPTLARPEESTVEDAEEDLAGE